MDALDHSEPRRHLELVRPRELSWDTEPDRGPITRGYAVALMQALSAEAGDRIGWSPRDIMSAFDELRAQERPVLRRAAFYVLDLPESVAADIAEVGPHWEVRASPVAAPAEPMCPKHPDTRWAACRTCRPISTGRTQAFWDERARVAAEDHARRERLREAEAADLRRRDLLGIPELNHH